MTRHDELLYLGDMLDFANKAINIARGQAFHDLEHDMVIQYALLHVL